MARFARTRSIALVVVAALGLALAAGLSIGRADEPPDLPPIAADELLASSLLALAERTPISGTVQTHLDLGLPQLPGALADPAGPAQLLLADQTFKIWRSSDGVRVAQILPFAERVLAVNPTDVWAWDSDRFTAWHVPVPSGVRPPPGPSFGDPQALAGTVLEGTAPYADVSVDRTTWVAGRAAYVLVLAPTSSDTLVGRIEAAIDAGTRLPLRLQVFARGSLDPAIEAGFTSVDVGPIDPSMFTFVPPDGATVEEISPGDLEGTGRDEAVAAGDFPQVRTFGEGFGLVVAVRVTEVSPEVRQLLPYAGPFASADLVERGDHAWIVAGAVAPDVLARVEPKLR